MTARPPFFTSASVSQHKRQVDLVRLKDKEVERLAIITHAIFRGRPDDDCIPADRHRAAKVVRVRGVGRTWLGCLCVQQGIYGAGVGDAGGGHRKAGLPGGG